MFSRYFSELKRFLYENRYVIPVFLAGTLADAYATALAVSRPAVVELNPVSGGFIFHGSVLKTTIGVSIPSLLILGLIALIWVRYSQEELMKLAIEGAGVLQLAAAGNNMLLYWGYLTAVPFLVLAALFGSYVTRAFLIWKKNRAGNDMLSRLPNPWK